MSGATVSVISIGVLRTPEGKAVADRPSLPGRAPVPPAWKGFTTNASPPYAWAPVSPGPAMMTGFQRQDAPSAGTAPGSSACSRQPRTTSGSICPIEWRAETAAGGGALSSDPGGAETSIAASDPALFGTSEPTMQRTPNELYARV